MKTREELRNERVSAVLELGFYFDKLIRDGLFNDPKAVELSEELHKVEKELYAIEKANQENKDALCPSCKKPLDNSSKFCINCGFNIEEYQNRIVDSCDFCGFEIEEGTNYCVVCGKKTKN